MPKSAIEKAIEKQMKQDKQLAAKRKREEDKRVRESREAARKVAIREQAMTIVNGQPIINGLRIMDDASEEVFKMILSVYEPNDERFVKACGRMYGTAKRARNRLRKCYVYRQYPRKKALGAMQGSRSRFV